MSSEDDCVKIPKTQLQNFKFLSKKLHDFFKSISRVYSEEEIDGVVKIKISVDEWVSLHTLINSLKSQIKCSCIIHGVGTDDSSPE